MRCLGGVILAALAWCSSNAAALAEKRIALVVGNSAYQNITRLDNPKNDPLLMAETLGGLGFTLIGGGAPASGTGCRRQAAAAGSAAHPPRIAQCPPETSWVSCLTRISGCFASPIAPKTLSSISMRAPPPVVGLLVVRHSSTTAAKGVMKSGF